MGYVDWPRRCRSPNHRNSSAFVVLTAIVRSSVNVRCVRILAPNHAAFLVLAEDNASYTRQAPIDGAGTPEPGCTGISTPNIEPPPRLRFLWRLDKTGRFGDPDPALVVALGDHAPRSGETIEVVRLRAGIENGPDLAAAVEKRETFARLTVLWRVADGVHARCVTFSGAPVFDNAREWIGFKGFGTIGETVEVRMQVQATDAVTGRAKAEPDDEPVKVEPGLSPEAGKGSSEVSSSPSEHVKADGPVSPSVLDLDPSSNPLITEARSAEIYAFRHGQSALPTASKIVPIRPGAFDVSRPQEAVETGDGSIELSKAEREAFREIARALVGRAPVSRQDTTAAAPDDGVDGRERLRQSSGASVPPPDANQNLPEPAVNPTFVRDALALLDIVPIGLLVAREVCPLYVNRSLLALLGYRDREHFDSANGLFAMFHGRVPPPTSDTEDDAVSVFNVEGQKLAIEGRVQEILWDGSPASLIILRPTRVPRSFDQHKGEDEAHVAGGGTDLLETFDLATDGAVVLDPAGRIQSFSASAERLFGYSEEEVAGESVLMLLAPGSRPATTAKLDAFGRLVDGPGSEPPIPVVGRDRNGAALALAMSFARVRPRAALHCYALFRDMRREREAERRLTTARDAAIAASSAKTEFLSHVSHEIRTPLHAILGFTEVMMEERFGPVGNDRYRDYLKDIHASGRHVISLADDLLDISKIEFGQT